MNEGGAKPRDNPDSRLIEIKHAASRFLTLLELDGCLGSRATAPVQVNLAPFVTVHIAAAATGYSAKAIQTKIARGVWVEGREWVRAPDGRVLISIAGFARWVESGGSR